MKSNPRYLVHIDLTAYEKCLRSRAKREWRTWMRYAASFVPVFCTFCAGAFVVGQMFMGGMSRDGIIASTCFGFFVGPIYALLQYESNIKQAVQNSRGVSWDCEHADENYCVTDPNGSTTHYPWRLMKIEASDPDYWDVSCRSLEIIVFREPLRQAGLEEDFERRLGKDSDGNKTDT